MTGFTTAQLVHISDVRMPETPELELWRVKGLQGLYPTKISAEIAARAFFPNESIELRYARIYFVRYEASP